MVHINAWLFWYRWPSARSLILAEHYGDGSSWLGGDQWDTIMNYDAFMEPLSWFLTGLEKHSDRADGHLYQNSRQPSMLYGGDSHFFEISRTY